MAVAKHKKRGAGRRSLLQATARQACLVAAETGDSGCYRAKKGKRVVSSGVVGT
jgi:hypothetical protein